MYLYVLDARFIAEHVSSGAASKCNTPLCGLAALRHSLITQQLFRFLQKVLSQTYFSYFFFYQDYRLPAVQTHDV